MESHTRGVRVNFTAGVHPDIRKLLLVEKVKDNDELLELAERIESSVRDEKRIFNDTKQIEVAATTSSRGRGFNKGQFRGRGNRNGNSTQKGESRCFLCQSLEHWADKCPNRGRSSRGRGFNKGQFKSRGGRGGYGQTSKTASVETHHPVDHASSIKGDSQQQQQQQPPQLEDTADPYYHINQALVELNPYSHQ